MKAERPVRTRWRYVVEAGTGIVHDLGSEVEECHIEEIGRAMLYWHPMHVSGPVEGIPVRECEHCNPDLQSWSDEVAEEG